LKYDLELALHTGGRIEEVTNLKWNIAPPYDMEIKEKLLKPNTTFFIDLQVDTSHYTDKKTYKLKNSLGLGIL